MDGEHSLHLAVKAGNIEVVEDLLNSGANVNLKNKDGKTPLHVAFSRYVSREAADKIMADDFRRNEVTKFRALGINLEPVPRLPAGAPRYCCALTLDGWLRDARLVELLLDAGADLDAPDEDGNTALHLVCRIRSARDVKVLLEHGARLDIKNKEGLTPHDILMQLEAAEVASAKEKRLSRYTTLYDVLDFDMMLAHAGNEELRRTLESEDFVKVFPKIAAVLRAQHKRAVLRRELLERAHDALILISRLNIPEECSNMIFRVFSEKELGIFVSM